MLKAALWSVNLDITNGQNIVTRRVIEGQSDIDWCLAFYPPGGGRALGRVLSVVAKLWRWALLGRGALVYIACSRSTVGFLRDLPALVLARFGFRVVIHVHGSDISDLLTRRRVSSLARAMYSRCEIIVPSSHVIDELTGQSFRAVHLCENFLPTELPGEVREDPDRDGVLQVVWNSNVIASKGFFDVAEAVALVAAAGHEIRMVAVGVPMDDQEMTQAEAELRLARLVGKPWFKHLGRVRPAVAAALVGRGDVVALPSRYGMECQPLALIQAMCLGREVIILDTPALRATAGAYPAMVVSDSSPQSIADVLVTLLSRDAIRRIELDDAAKAARQRFSQERFDARMRDILIEGGPAE